MIISSTLTGKKSSNRVVVMGGDAGVRDGSGAGGIIAPSTGTGILYW